MLKPLLLADFTGEFFVESFGGPQDGQTWQSSHGEFLATLALHRIPRQNTHPQAKNESGR
jgi:hypothetical protein